MNREVENVLAVLDGFRMTDQMDYEAYSHLHDMISVLDVPGWISVKDRLPEDESPVLVWESQGFAYVDNFINGDWNLGKLNMAIITHWMPLPEPPKEE